MLDALFVGFDVAVKHRGVRMKPNLVRRARDSEPLLATDLVITDYLADAWIENFSASTRQRIHARVFEREQRIADGKLGDARKIAHLDHSKRLEMDTRTASLQSPDQVEKILKRKIGMKATDHVEFRGAFAKSLFGALPNLFESKRIGSGRFRTAAKGAELAMRDANIGGI